MSRDVRTFLRVSAVVAGTLVSFSLWFIAIFGSNRYVEARVDDYCGEDVRTFEVMTPGRLECFPEDGSSFLTPQAPMVWDYSIAAVGVFLLSIAVALPWEALVRHRRTGLSGRQKE